MFKALNGEKKIVPVVMFHSIGMENSSWVFSHVSEPVKYFEQKVASLKKFGYNFIFWNELYLYMQGEKKLKLPAVMLTFDDGYLDNWVHVFPILKKYGAKATIFVNPDFVDPSDTVRPNMEDLHKSCMGTEEFQVAGFLNWPEMRFMEKSGIVDIQSHAKTHTWYFSEPELEGFHRPGCKKYPWMAWNRKPDQKPFYLNNDQSTVMASGTPVYKYEKDRVCRRYFPPKEIEEKITEHVKNSGGDSFFNKTGWEVELKSLHENLFKKYKASQYYETHDQYKKRVLKELVESKLILEENLNKKISFICWPGGGYNNDVLHLAQKAGYISWTLSSIDLPDFKNISRSDPKHIKRIPSGSIQKIMGIKLGYINGVEFLDNIRRHQGAVFYKWSGRVRKILKFIYLFKKGGKNKKYIQI